MEGPFAQPPPLPRLRLSRQPLAAVADRPIPQEDPHAGPSRPRDQSVGDLDDAVARDEDPVPTPKAQPNSNGSPGDATLRLRALLQRIPNQSQARPASPSEVDSDFDPPRFSPPPTEAKKSLKDVFSYALRDPGDTPVKSRRIRRNSTSEVEEIPREGAKSKAKRKSLSDEELEKSNRSSQRSEASLRTSQAATFDLLREKLNNSQTPLKNEVPPAPLYDNSTAEQSMDTATFLRDLNSSRATPPAATSTPPHSMEISADSKFQTNLMDHDSEMQHMMKDLDSYEGDSGRSRPVSFPSSRGKPTRPGSSNAHSSTSQSHRLSYNGGTRPGHHIHHDPPPEVLHEREREWNKPHPKAAPKHERQHSHGPDNTRSHSPSVPVNGHARTRSGGSAHGTEDGLSSKGTSVGSHSDYKERIHDLEKERNAERENAWNRPQATRSTSTRSVHSPVERSRKLSQPLRPGSSHSLLPPVISRSHSVSSHSSHTGSDDEEEEIQHEIKHERERNWNAPIPHWHQHPSPGHHIHARSKSPVPPSSSASTPSNVRIGDRVRAESLRTRGTPKGDSPIHRTESPRPIATSSKISTHETSAPQARPKSLLGSSSRPRPMSYPARPNSPLPPPRPHSPLPPLEGKSKSKPALSTSHSTHKLTPQPRSPIRERGHSKIPSSPSPSPGQRPASRTSISHIPIRSPRKAQSKASNGHSETAVTPQTAITASLQQAVQVPEISEPENQLSGDESQNSDLFTESDDGDHPESRTPTVDTFIPPPPPAEPPRAPTPPSPQSMDTTPEAAPTTFLASLSTPPRRQSFSSARLEFQTPSPPHGLPELPGPPSSSDEETETERPAATPLRLNGDITAKTPRPPGAWASTPAPMPRSHSLPPEHGDSGDTTSTKTPRAPGAWASTPAPVARAHSLPPEHDDSDSQYEGGLATPVPSLSRASSLPAQTPKPPGGWVATPTPRKSILKVRFDPQPAELELSATEDFSSTNGHPEESALVSATGLATPAEDRVRTPELPTTPVSPSRSPRRSPTIRMVDEYGRPDKFKPTKSPKNRNKIRIVDAMGREVETDEQSIKTEVSDDVPLDRDEALRVVREGVADLVQGLNELDTSSDFVLLDEYRLKELDNASRAAREAREDLRQAYQNDRTAQLRASMRRSKNDSRMAREVARSPSPRIWLWTFIILFQALFIFMIYRIQRRSLRDLFLTTYYDPFYPDLHLYGIKYDYMTFPRTSPSAASLSNTLRQEGFKAFVGSLVDMVVVIFDDLRADTWRRWGADDMQSVRWPPT
ncbi:hypothetical protein B0H19DRAFT_1091527 [Mycena capillaripes]|nr:hypothetical protein B0H19DRAFT_1091527 [Mycena capillaripes]